MPRQHNELITQTSLFGPGLLDTFERSDPRRATARHVRVERGILISFDQDTYTANVLIPAAANTYLEGIPIATHFDSTSAIPNAPCVVVFFDLQNLSDAVLFAVFPNDTQGIPDPPPGRAVFIAGHRHLNNQVINSGSTHTFTATGSGGIPTNAKGVIYTAFFTSATVGSFIRLAPQGASDITAYASVGNLYTGAATARGNGVLPLSSTGQITIQANTGQCLVTFYTYGYIL